MPIPGLVIFLIIVLILGVRVVQQYERAVVLRFGKVLGSVRQPGLTWIIPFVDQMRKVNMRIITMPVQSQKIISKDNVSIDVAAVAYYHVNDPVKSIVEIDNVIQAINQIAQTTVRNVVGQSNLDEVLSNTEKINNAIKAILDVTTEKWGIIIDIVELKDIQLPDSMQRAMAKQAEAEREKRAKIIAAEGEFLSADKLGQAADIIAKHPVALQLRNLQVLTEVATDKNSTIIFPSQFMDKVSEITDFVKGEVKK